MWLGTPTRRSRKLIQPRAPGVPAPSGVHKGHRYTGTGQEAVAQAVRLRGVAFFAGVFFAVVVDLVAVVFLVVRVDFFAGSGDSDWDFFVVVVFFVAVEVDFLPGVCLGVARGRYV